MKNVKITMRVPIDKIQGGFINALEGGSNYWITKAEQIKGPKPSEKGVVFWGSANIYGPTLVMKFTHENPNSTTGKTMTTLVTWKDVERGLQVMAEKETRHFADLMTDEGDSTTADVFLQCCIFGKTIFG